MLRNLIFLSALLLATPTPHIASAAEDVVNNDRITVLVRLSTKAKRDLGHRLPPALQTLVAAPGAELVGITRDTHDAVLKVDSAQLWALMRYDLVTSISKDIPPAKNVQRVSRLEIESKLSENGEVTDAYGRLGRIINPPDRNGIFTLEPRQLDGKLMATLMDDERVLTVNPNMLIVQ